ncbi:MAG: DUF2628 domain-containing protein [Bauldia sp.]|nr:DUF2628 domain-containing protein [Bauldia sp.]
MALYTVHAPRSAEGAATDPADLVFVKDGFCWPALFIPLVWLVWRRLWLVLLLYVVGLVGLSILSGLAGDTASTAVTLLFAVWFALEANGLRRWTLERTGRGMVGVVEGRTAETAECRWFAAAEASVPVVRSAPAPSAPRPPAAADAAAAKMSPPSPPPAPKVPPPPRPAEPGIVGLFPAPGARP